MIIGVLAVQGDFQAHKRMLTRVGVSAKEVRRRSDLNEVDGLIIPGGESTTILKFLGEDNLFGAIKEFGHRGRPLFGTCAGAILLAREVCNPAQPSLELIDIRVERNAYGRQLDSFIASAETEIEGGPIEAVFIRAPQITGAGPNVEVIASLHGKPVFVREGHMLATTFHPELTDDERAHRLFVSMVSSSLEGGPRPERELLRSL